MDCMDCMELTEQHFIAAVGAVTGPRVPKPGALRRRLRESFDRGLCVQHGRLLCYQGLPLALLLICEDDGLGISASARRRAGWRPHSAIDPLLGTRPQMRSNTQVSGLRHARPHIGVAGHPGFGGIAHNGGHYGGHSLWAAQRPLHAAGQG